jgi:D-alanyl-lipoteichoic acid acyltransferase DltB (MBOAT superfamily)
LAFHTWQFGLFLIAVLALFWALSRRRGARLGLLLVASYWFYGSWEPWFLLLIAFSTVLDYACGIAIERSGTRSGKRVALLCSLVGNLGLLFFFKYSAWIGGLLQPLVDWLDLGFTPADWGWAKPDGEGGWAQKLVPVGISFYTFQTLSYTIDIYRGVLRPTKSFRDFALFVAFFPQLVAGPIVRAVDFLPQLDLAPRLDRARLHDGLWRIGIGLAKKALIADVLGRYLVDPVYASPEGFSPLLHLAALYAFTFQIYFDFAGYSDIAIGVGRLFGFDLPENFRAPYQSLSIREFWRRWHITLSSWVRDYVFFPLGGSRGSELKVVRNLFVTMVLIGLWHGASILWVYYGLLQGGVMALERRFEAWRGGRPFATTAPRKALAWLLTFHFVAFSCLFIRAVDVEQLTSMLSTFGPAEPVERWAWIALAVGALTHFLPQRFVDACADRVRALPTAVLGLALGLLCGALIWVMVGDSTAFIYFQF